MGQNNICFLVSSFTRQSDRAS